MAACARAPTVDKCTGVRRVGDGFVQTHTRGRIKVIDWPWHAPTPRSKLNPDQWLICLFVCVRVCFYASSQFPSFYADTLIILRLHVLCNEAPSSSLRFDVRNKRKGVPKKVQERQLLTRVASSVLRNWTGLVVYIGTSLVVNTSQASSWWATPYLNLYSTTWITLNLQPQSLTAAFHSHLSEPLWPFRAPVHVNLVTQDGFW